MAKKSLMQPVRMDETQQSIQYAALCVNLVTSLKAHQQLYALTKATGTQGTLLHVQVNIFVLPFMGRIQGALGVTS